MADQKIGDLTALTGATVDATNDIIPIVDTSAGTGGTTKQISVDELFKSVVTTTNSTTTNTGTVNATVKVVAPILDSNAGTLTLKGATTTAQTITGANTVFAGTITPTQTGGIIGTTTNNSVQAGSVGELITASLAQGSQIGLSTGVSANITSISLTAGDWDVDGVLHFNYGATDAVTALTGSTSSTSATHGAVDTQAVRIFPSAGQVQSSQVAHRMPVPTNRFLLASTTIVFLVATATFTGAYNAHGMIRARRVR